MNAENAPKKELLSLRINQIGFVVYGIGPGAKWFKHKDMTLMEYLDGVWKKMFRLKKELNRYWYAFRSGSRKTKARSRYARRLMKHGEWAYAEAVELTPLAKHCLYGPTDPMRTLIIEPLEETYMRCFAAVHLFGKESERPAALKAIVRDFEENGGIDPKTGGPGSGLSITILTCFMAYFAPNDCVPAVYDRFGDVMEAYAKLVLEKYPKVRADLARHFDEMLAQENHGFAGTQIQLPAKTALKERLARLRDELVPPVAEKAA